jgi:hypothetical protein
MDGLETTKWEKLTSTIKGTCMNLLSLILTPTLSKSPSNNNNKVQIAEEDLKKKLKERDLTMEEQVDAIKKVILLTPDSSRHSRRMRREAVTGRMIEVMQ